MIISLLRSVTPVLVHPSEVSGQWCRPDEHHCRQVVTDALAGGLTEASASAGRSGSAGQGGLGILGSFSLTHSSRNVTRMPMTRPRACLWPADSGLDFIASFPVLGRARSARGGENRNLRRIAAVRGAGSDHGLSAG